MDYFVWPKHGIERLCRRGTSAYIFVVFCAKLNLVVASMLPRLFQSLETSLKPKASTVPVSMVASPTKMMFERQMAHCQQRIGDIQEQKGHVS